MHIPPTALYDVVIAGAGPVGLFFACELRLAGCSVLVLEQAQDPHSPLKMLPFGLRGLSVPTVESLDRRDLLDTLKARVSLGIKNESDRRHDMAAISNEIAISPANGIRDESDPKLHAG